MLAQTERALARIADGTLRRLRELREADRQDAGDGVPACHTVPDMQAARGASLNPSDPRPSPAGDPPAPAGATARCLRSSPRIAASATPSTWSPRCSPSSDLTGRAPVRVVGDLLHARPRAQPGRGVQHRHVVHRCVLSLRRGRGRGRRARGSARRLRQHRLGGRRSACCSPACCGNLTDRLFRAPGPLRGHVVDFLQLPHWPIFNVADMLHRRRGGADRRPGAARDPRSTATRGRRRHAGPTRRAAS